MASQTPSKQFYFVNKSEKSTYLSKSLSLEKAAIQRHVQTGRRRKRNAKAAPDKAENRSLVIPVQQDVQPINQKPESAKRTSPTQYPDPLPHSGKASPASEAPAVSLSPERILHKADPFSATCIAIDQRVAGLLHYYIFYHHPSQWPNEMALLRHGVYVFQAEVLKNLKMAIANKLVMYCLLGATACRLQFVDRLPCPLVTGTENFYLHEAVRLMASYITTNNFEDPEELRQCLMCMSFLGAAEAYRGDMAAAQAHLSGSIQLLKTRGGLSAVNDQNLQKHIAMGDLFLACVNLKPCQLDHAYDPGPASSLALTHLELQGKQEPSTASSLLNRDESIIPPDLAKVIAEVVESHHIRSRILTTGMLPKRAMQVTHWITVRNMAIRNRLLALYTTDPRIHVLRTAIIMWTLLAMNITGRAKTVKIMASKLKHLLSAMSPAIWTENEDVRLWVLLVGTHCTDEDGQDFAWFMDEVHQLSGGYRRAALVSAAERDLAEHIERFQRRFFFDVLVQSTRTRVIARRLQQRRPECPNNFGNNSNT